MQDKPDICTEIQPTTLPTRPETNEIQIIMTIHRKCKCIIQKQMIYADINE